MDVYSAHKKEMKEKYNQNVLKRDFWKHEKDRYLHNLSFHLERAHISRSLSFIPLRATQSNVHQRKSPIKIKESCNSFPMRHTFDN